MAELKLIAIQPAADNKFLKVVERLRSKAGDTLPSLADITQEIEAVRARRYGKGEQLYAAAA